MANVMTSLGFNIYSRFDGSGVREAHREIARLDSSISKLNTSFRAAGGGARPLITAAIALTPALAQVGVVAGTAAVAVVASMGAASIAAGAYGFVLAQTVLRMNELVASGAELSEAQQGYLDSAENLSETWGAFLDAHADQTLSVAIDGIDGLAAGIEHLNPIIDATHPIIKRASEAWLAWMEGDGAARFADSIVTYGVPALDDLMDAGRNMLAVFGEGFRAFLPLGNEFTSVLLRGSEVARAWAEDGGFQRFLEFVAARTPQVSEFLRALWDALVNVGRAIFEVAPNVLSLTTAILNLIASMDPGVIQAFFIAFMALRGIAAVVGVVGMVTASISALAGLFSVILPGALLVFKIAWINLQVALAVTPGLGWILIAIGAVIAVIVLIATKTTWFQDIWAAAWEKIQQAASWAWENVIKPVFDAISRWWGENGEQIVATIVGVFTSIWDSVVLAFMTAKAVIGKIWAELVEWWARDGEELFAKMAALVIDIKDTLLQIGSEVGKIWSMFSEAWNKDGKPASDDINGSLSEIQAVAGFVGDVVGFLISNLSNVFGVFGGLLSTALSVIEVALANVRLIFSVFAAAFTGDWSTVWENIKSLVGSALELLGSIVKTGLNIVLALVGTNVDEMKEKFGAAWEDIKSKWNAAWTWISDVFTGIWAALTGYLIGQWESWKGVFSTALEWVKGLWNTAWTWVSDRFIEVWTVLSSFINERWEFIKGVFNAALEWVKNLWNTVWTWVSDTFASFVGVFKIWLDAWGSYLQDKFGVVLEWVKNLWNTVWTWVHDRFVEIWTVLSSFINERWEWVKATFNAALEWVKNLWNVAWTWVSDRFNEIWTVLTNYISERWEFWKNLFNTALEWVKNVWNIAWTWVSDRFNEIWTALTNYISERWEFWKNLFNTALEWVKNLWNIAWTWIHDRFVEIWTVLSSFISERWEWVKSTFSAALEWVKDLWNTVWTWVSDRFNEIWTVLSAFISERWEFIKSIFSAGGDWLRTTFWDPLYHFFTRTIPDTFNTAVDAIRGFWDRLKDVVAAPIKWVVNTVWNDGLVKAWNWINDLWSGGDTSPFMLPFAEGGGVSTGGGGGMQAYAHGGPVHGPGSGTSDSISARLSNNEHVWTAREVTAAGGHGAVAAMRSSVLGGEPVRVMGAEAYALGGAVGGPLDFRPGPGFDAAFGAAASLGGFVKSMDELRKTVTSGEGAIPGVLKTVANLPRKAIDAVVEWVTKKLTPSPSGGSPMGWQQMWDVVRASFPDGTLTSALRQGDPGYHGSGNAIDVAWGMDNAGKARMMDLNKWIAEKYPQSTELIHTPGINLKNGKPMNYGTETQAAHWNHVHWAMAGGQAFTGADGWRALAMAELAHFNQPMSLTDLVLRRIQQESGGNARAINNWDSNAQAGTPSKGLMQVIDPTFAAYKNKTGIHPDDIWDPGANVHASMNYALARYGSLESAYGRSGGYFMGTPGAHAGIATAAEKGMELITRGPVMRKFRGGEKVWNNKETMDLITGGQMESTSSGDTIFNIDLSGSTTEAVDKFKTEVIPKLRVLINKGTGKRYGG